MSYAYMCTKFKITHDKSPPILYSEGQKGAASASGKSRGQSLEDCVGDIVYTRVVITDIVRYEYVIDDEKA